MNGFRFVVSTREDGSQPLLRSMLYQQQGGDSIRLFRQISGRYLPFIDWNQQISPPDVGSGVLMPPGTYFMPESEMSGNPYPAALPAPSHLLGGEWATPHQQTRYWQVRGNDYATVSSSIGVLKGFRFTVTPRPDGSLAYFNQLTSLFEGGHMRIFRLNGESYLPYAYVMPQFSNRGFLFDAGTYIILVGSALPDSLKYRNMVLMTGYWAVP